MCLLFFLLFSLVFFFDQSGRDGQRLLFAAAREQLHRPSLTLGLGDSSFFPFLFFLENLEPIPPMASLIFKTHASKHWGLRNGLGFMLTFKKKKLIDTIQKIGRIGVGFDVGVDASRQFHVRRSGRAHPQVKLES